MHYVASFQNLGNAALQGVHCTVEEVLDDSCLHRLETYISDAGGLYFNYGNVPPPNFGSDCSDSAH